VDLRLLLATGELTLDGDMSALRPGGQSGRIEDTDLLVMLEKSDCTLVLVLIEAKGVTPFGKTQFGSKVKRLRALHCAAANATEWLTTIMLLMSPKVSRPSPTNRREFVKTLADVGFWPSGGNPALVWMELKNFFLDVGEPNRSLCIVTAWHDGSRAKNITERSDNPYTHWRVARRFGTKR
jgi:hypothetical protein